MDMKDQKLAAAIAEERMKLIAPLLAPNLDRATMTKLRIQIGDTYQISTRTIERYCKRYLEGGFDALKPQSKSSRTAYKIPQELLEEAIQLRKELPSRNSDSGAGRKSGARVSQTHHSSGCLGAQRLFHGDDEGLS